MSEIEEILERCKPYLVNLRRVEEIINELKEKISGIQELNFKLKEELMKAEDPTLKTDLRILISELEAELKRRAT